MVALVIGLALLSLALIPLESRWPGVSLQRRFRSGWLLDLVYWFFTMLITRPVSKVAVAIVLFPLLWISGAGSFENLLQGFGPLGRQPRLDQAMQMIIVIDFTGYWLHRAFHSRRLWPFHAIHHSSTDLDWLSAARVHPVNDIVEQGRASGDCRRARLFALAASWNSAVLYFLRDPPTCQRELGFRSIEKNSCQSKISPLASYLGASRTGQELRRLATRVG